MVARYRGGLTAIHPVGKFFCTSFHGLGIQPFRIGKTKVVAEREEQCPQAIATGPAKYKKIIDTLSCTLGRNK